MIPAIVTAIFGGIDQRKIFPASIERDFDIHFFDESNMDLKLYDYAPRVRALYYKTQMYKALQVKFAPNKYEAFIWVDGKVQILRDDFVDQCVEQLGHHDIGILKHGERDCIYDEMEFIRRKLLAQDPYFVSRYLYRSRILKEQIESYRKAGYPEHRGLGDCCILIIRHNDLTRMLVNKWWDDCRRELFDQVSIQFLCWKAGIHIQPLEFTPETFCLVKHLKYQ